MNKPIDESPSASERDRIFAEQRAAVDFHFGKETTAVFDDMLNRSVPFYGEIQRMTSELALDFASNGACVYDLGCSTCNTFLQLGPLFPENLRVRFIGIDSSEQMLEKARGKLRQAGFKHDFELQNGDLNQGIHISNACVVILTLTLQFIRPMQREPLLQSIYRGMNERGVLIIVDKVLGENSAFNRLFITHYYDFKKRNGYSELEIAQKREALENVLIPYHHTENLALLRKVGFQEIDTFFKWYNFCGIVAIK
jgi:tRNA (cmo5U34)-methyltransferase